MIGPDPYLMGAVGAGGGSLVLLLWLAVVLRWRCRRYHREQLREIDRLTPLANQTRRDSWQAVRDIVYQTLQTTNGRIPLKEIRSEFEAVQRVWKEGSRDIREALNELSNTRRDQLPAWAEEANTDASRVFPFDALDRQA